MKATIDIPEPIARRLGELAQRNGGDFEDQIVQVLRILLPGDAAVAEWDAVLREARSGESFVVDIKVSHHGRKSASFEMKHSNGALPAPAFSVDPVTGLPVVNSPPDAPIRRMSAAEFQAVIDQANEEADLEHAGIPLRR